MNRSELKQAAVELAQTLDKIESKREMRERKEEEHKELMKTMEKLTDGISSLESAVKQIKKDIPKEIKLGDFKVPRIKLQAPKIKMPKVKVEVPEVKVTVPEVKLKETMVQLQEPEWFAQNNQKMQLFMVNLLQQLRDLMFRMDAKEQEMMMPEAREMEREDDEDDLMGMDYIRDGNGNIIATRELYGDEEVVYDWIRDYKGRVIGTRKRE